MIATTSTITNSVEHIDSIRWSKVGESLESYLSWMSKNGNSEKTVDDRRRSLSKTLVELGIYSADQLNAELIQHWIDSKSFEHSFKAINSNLNSLKHFSNWLLSSGRLSVDPTAGHKFQIDADDSSIERFQHKFQRLFRIIEYVSTCRIGATLELVHEHQCELWKICERTTRRDLDLLMIVGFITKERYDSVELVLYKTNPFSRFQLETKRAKKTPSDDVPIGRERIQPGERNHQAGDDQLSRVRKY